MISSEESAGADEREGGPWTSADRYGDVTADEDGEPGPPTSAFDGEDEYGNEVRRTCSWKVLLEMGSEPSLQTSLVRRRPCQQ